MSDEKIKSIKFGLERFGRVNKEDIPFLINLLNDQLSEIDEKEYQIITEAYDFLSLEDIRENSIERVFDYIKNNELIDISKSQIRTTLNTL
jgi:tRNA threonylcarbamoyladenosine modification (KEOPS) complex Cgi121 subunit